MGAHAGSAVVQAKGCGALWNIANKNKDNAVAIHQAGGVEAIASATKAFPSDAELRRYADGAMKVIKPKLGRSR